MTTRLVAYTHRSTSFLVSVAVMAGAINRFMGMPSLIAGLRSGNSAAKVFARRFTMILRVEAGVLLGVLVLAAVLSVSSPPVSG